MQNFLWFSNGFFHDFGQFSLVSQYFLVIFDLVIFTLIFCYSLYFSYFRSICTQLPTIFVIFNQFFARCTCLRIWAFESFQSWAVWQKIVMVQRLCSSPRTRSFLPPLKVKTESTNFFVKPPRETRIKILSKIEG